MAASAAINRNAGTGKEFVISRMLDAPRDLVWTAWTQGERLAQWWGPQGCKIRIVKLELRPGGVVHYAMTFPSPQPWLKGSNEMWGRFIYREIATPERIVFINSFSDAKGGITRAPFSETWPLEVLVTVTLVDKGGKTELTLRAGPINTTTEENETFAGMHDSMRQGYGGTFDQLAVYLATAKA
jgi:uncharacterized protein YndB with AHSA1/START domain